jgi:hypothetical protein
VTQAPRILRLLAALAVAAGSLAAQVVQRDAGPRPVAIDVHVLKITSAAAEPIPKAEVVASERVPSGERGETREFSFRVDGTRFGIKLHDIGSGSTMLERKTGNWTSAAPLSGPTLDLSDPWRWGRRPRHGTLIRTSMLTVPVADAASPFEPLDVRGFLRKATAILLETEAGPLDGRNRDHADWMSPQWMAARLLGSFPLRDYLEPAQVDLILANGEKLAKGGRLPVNTGNWFWPLLRPLVVLGHRATLEAIEREPEGGHEVEMNGEFDGDLVKTPSVPRSIEDSLLIAYATAEDPEIRGLAGWIATGTRSSDVYDSLIADVRSGRAVLPGDFARREALATHLVHARAWQATTPPILTLAASALAIAAAMVLLRIAMRRVI